jgi:uncharacterized protein
MFCTTYVRTERFSLALMKRDLAAAAALIAQGAQVDQTGSDDRTPLMGAAAHGDLEVMRFLIDKGANPAREGVNDLSALDVAVRAGHDDAAALLLKRNIMIDRTGSTGSTATAATAATVTWSSFSSPGARR